MRQGTEGSPGTERKSRLTSRSQITLSALPPREGRSLFPAKSATADCIQTAMEHKIYVAAVAALSILAACSGPKAPTQEQVRDKAADVTAAVKSDSRAMAQAFGKDGTAINRST